MGRGAGGGANESGREHRRFDRQFTAGLVVVVLLLGAGFYALVRRADANAAKRSRPGDACAVVGHTRTGDSALDGVAAFDRATGEVLWTNVVDNGSQLGRRGDELVIVSEDDHSERVVDAATGAITSCGGQPDDIVVTGAGSGRFEAGGDNTLDLGSMTIQAAGDGADVRALAPDGSELWATDAGNPAVGGRATVSSPIHAAALTPDGRAVVVLTSATLEDPD